MLLIDQLILLLMAFSAPGAQARVLPHCTPAPGRSAEQVEGEVSGAGLLEIAMKGRETENLSSLTPPFHFAPNPRQIEGWHFRNADNTGPNDGTWMNSSSRPRAEANAPLLSFSSFRPVSLGRGFLSPRHCFCGFCNPQSPSEIPVCWAMSGTPRPAEEFVATWRRGGETGVYFRRCGGAISRLI